MEFTAPGDRPEPKFRKTKPHMLPFCIVVDRREKAPYCFRGIPAPMRLGGGFFVVPTQWQTLKTGDYSIAGFEHRFCVERKSIADLFGTLAGARDRFEKEHERMSQMDFAAVVVESTWEEIAKGNGTRMSPESVLNTAASWSVRYGVHWIAVDGRSAGERMTLRLARAFFKKAAETE